MKDRYGIILAAGQGSRMKSKLYKVLHPIAGKPMVEHVISQVEAVDPSEIVTIVGCGAEKVKSLLGTRCSYVLQEQQKGTGHAVLQAKKLLKNKIGTTLVICGDTPLLTTATLEKLFEYHQEKDAKATILTAVTENPTGYGRVIRDELGIVEKIVEEKDASLQEKLVKEINTGTYCFDNQLLFEALEKVGTANAQGEYYLTDVIGILKRSGAIVAAYRMPDFSESLGVNDRLALAEANQIMRTRINDKHMLNGVSIIDPNTTYIDSDVIIGTDTVIEPGVFLKGNTVIGEDCLIGAHSEIIDSAIFDRVKITSSHIQGAVVGNDSDIGPFGRLRPETKLGEHVHVGNFVEIKKSTIDDGTKVGHLTYVGDASLGKQINVGCGTVFVNYDGKEKHHTTVGDNSFIGCNTNLIAPLSIGESSFVAAGSTITRNVPKEAMAIARTKQINKEEYAKKLPYSS